MLKTKLRDLNSALQAWGYSDNPRAFIDQFNIEVRRASAGEAAARSAWVDDVECWIGEGDRILDDVQALLASGVMESLRADELSKLWEELAAVSFKVAYVMAGVEARLDYLQTANPLCFLPVRP